MSFVTIALDAPALRDQKYPGLPFVKKGDYVSWGILNLKELLSEEGIWHFFAPEEANYDDFWGARSSGEYDQTNRVFSVNYARGNWTNQININLLLWSEWPKRRLAVTLFQFTPRSLHSGSQGQGKIVRGNTLRLIQPNPVIGPRAHMVVDDATDGKSASVKWRVISIRDRWNQTRYQRLVDASP
jgi:hypothetical protein